MIRTLLQHNPWTMYRNRNPWALFAAGTTESTAHLIGRYPTALGAFARGQAYIPPPRVLRGSQHIWIEHTRTPGYERGIHRVIPIQYETVRYNHGHENPRPGRVSTFMVCMRCDTPYTSNTFTTQVEYDVIIDGHACSLHVHYTTTHHGDGYPIFTPTRYWWGVNIKDDQGSRVHPLPVPTGATTLAHHVMNIMPHLDYPSRHAKIEAIRSMMDNPPEDILGIFIPHMPPR